MLRNTVVYFPHTEDAVDLPHRKWVEGTCNPRIQKTESRWFQTSLKGKKEKKKKSAFNELVYLFVNVAYL